MVELRDIVIINSCFYFVSLKSGAIAIFVVHILYNLTMLAMAFAGNAAKEKVVFFNWGSILIISLLVEQSLKIVYAVLSVIQIAVNGLGIYAITTNNRKFLLPAVALNGFLLVYELFAVIIFVLFSFHLPYALLIAIYVSKTPEFLPYIVVTKGMYLKYWIDPWLGLLSDVVDVLSKATFLPGYFLLNVLLLALLFHLFTVIYSYYTVLVEEGDEYYYD